MDDDALLRELHPVLDEPTHRTSAGWPYLTRPAWVRLRDWVPHTLGEGHRVWKTLERVTTAPDAVRVVRQIVRTAAVTAPPDLWLLRHVLGAMARTGWLQRLEAGVEEVPPALEPDVALLVGRGYLVRYGTGWRMATEGTARRVFHEVGPLPEGRPADLARRWAEALGGDPAEVDLLLEVVAEPPSASGHAAPAWVATPEDIELGYQLVPLVLGLRAAGHIPTLLEGGFDPLTRITSPALVEAAVRVLTAAGWAEGGLLTPIGRRGLEKGPGPFGIIEAYWPYLERLPRLWAGEQTAHVARAANVAASQDANRETFRQANDALDRFCADTGFRFSLFVEHAVGRGEATRQRYERAGGGLSYVGADLEVAAIAAAREEQAAGRLPASMKFVRADIGEPQALVEALEAEGLAPEGAVMLVGNGFHEVRTRSDARMVDVFRGYERAGIVLLFTEESALSVDDLLRTAWNTYHAGFRYVHERSGQGLRPASPGPAPHLGPPLPASWTECATRAGYVRAAAYCSRSRTIHPYPPANGHNPSVSANEFFVPARIAARYGLGS